MFSVFKKLFFLALVGAGVTSPVNVPKQEQVKQSSSIAKEVKPASTKLQLVGQEAAWIAPLVVALLVSYTLNKESDIPTKKAIAADCLKRYLAKCLPELLLRRIPYLRIRPASWKNSSLGRIATDFANEDLFSELSEKIICDIFLNSETLEFDDCAHYKLRAIISSICHDFSMNTADELGDGLKLNKIFFLNQLINVGLKSIVSMPLKLFAKDTPKSPTLSDKDKEARLKSAASLLDYLLGSICVKEESGKIRFNGAKTFQKGVSKFVAKQLPGQISPLLYGTGQTIKQKVANVGEPIIPTAKVGPSEEAACYKDYFDIILRNFFRAAMKEMMTHTKFTFLEKEKPAVVVQQSSLITAKPTPAAEKALKKEEPVEEAEFGDEGDEDDMSQSEDVALEK